MANIYRKLISSCRVAFVACVLSVSAFALGPQITQPDENTIEVHNAPEMQVIAVARNVVIKTSAKEVFVFGGDVIIEGDVAGDVGVIGGTITQREGASIGGDVIAIGGSYKAESSSPLRTAGTETIVFGILEDELKNLGRDPAGILIPQYSAAFFAQKLLFAFFWFLLTLGLSTVAPGAVSRAVARTKLSPSKIGGLGLAGLAGTIVLIAVGVAALPEYLGVVVWIMAVGVLLLAYLFGRVTLQVLVGKSALKLFGPAYLPNDTLSILAGVGILTVLLSLPFVWPLVVISVFAAGCGTFLTARTTSSSAHQ